MDLTAMGASLDTTQIINILIEEIRETVPELEGQAISGADSMVELGVNSIERSEVILAATERLGLKIPMVQLHGPKNIQELADLLLAKSAG
jgi:polyketide biosynthesis acyl carrier protein